MTTIKATCPVCGDVDLTPEDVLLTVAQSAGWAVYSFNCTGCMDSVEKPADDEVVALLSSAGVQVDQVPAEALELHAGPSLSYDDVLDFALWLESHDNLSSEVVPDLGASEDFSPA